MKTLAELKRTVKAGAKITVVSHWRDAVRTDQAPLSGTVRIITKTQGNGYWYDQGEKKRLWGDYPTTAKDISFDGDTFTIKFGDKGCATFRVEAA